MNNIERLGDVDKMTMTKIMIDGATRNLALSGNLT